VGDIGAGLPGRTLAEIAALFSIARPLRSSKVRRLPTRGALGNGLRVVAGAVLATDGHLEVETRGQRLRLVVQDDGTTAAELIGQTAERGTRIRVYLGPSLRVRETDLNEAHLTIALAGLGTTYRGLSSPHWYDADTFYELLQAAGHRAVRAVVATLDGCTGAKAGRITRDYHDRPANSLSRTEAADLLRQCQQASKLVRPERLGEIGPIDPPYRGYGRARGTIVVDGGATAVPAVVEVWMNARAMALASGACTAAVNEAERDLRQTPDDHGRYSIPMCRIADDMGVIPATLPAQIRCLGRSLVALLAPWQQDGRAGAIARTPLRACGGVWHQQDRKAGIVPHSSIDTAAHWAKSGWHGWVYGWRLHLITTVAAVWIPLAAELTPANVAANEQAPALLAEVPPQVRFLLGDHQYNDPALRE
jgi:hypothetical protein